MYGGMYRISHMYRKHGEILIFRYNVRCTCIEKNKKCFIFDTILENCIENLGKCELFDTGVPALVSKT